MSVPSGRLERPIRLTVLVSGLALFVFAAVELCGYAIGLTSLQTMGTVLAWQTAVFRSLPGAALLSVACVSHIGATLWIVARRATLRMSLWDGAMIVSGVLMPLLLVPYLVDTRGANAWFDVDDELLYRLARLWPDHAFLYVILIALIWGHGCLGLHTWLKSRAGYRAIMPVLAVIALAVPIAAVAGLIASARVVGVLMADDALAEKVRTTTHWPSIETENALWWLRLIGVTAYGALLLAVAAALATRILRIVVAPKIDLTYANGPTIKASLGPTLLEISRMNAVPHADACGGRGRCTACAVRVEQGSTSLPLRSAVEMQMLGMQDQRVRLACQIRPRAPLTVVRLADTAAASTEPELDHAGIERKAVTLCVQLRDHAALIDGRPAYDAIFLVNEFLDIVQASIARHHGWIARTTGSGIVAIFGLEASIQTACRAGLAASADIDLALDRLNERFAAELGRPIAVAMGLAFGVAYIGRIGAGSSKPLTAIGPVIDTASFLAARAEERGDQLLSDQATFEASTIYAAGFELTSLMAGDRASMKIYTTRHARLSAAVTAEV